LGKKISDSNRDAMPIIIINGITIQEEEDDDDMRDCLISMRLYNYILGYHGILFFLFL
jgi:hypothetical protein